MLSILVLPYGSLPPSIHADDRDQGSDPERGEDPGDDADGDSGWDEGPQHRATWSSDSNRSRSPRRDEVADEDASGGREHVLLPVVSSHESSLEGSTLTVIYEAKPTFPFDVFMETLETIQQQEKKQVVLLSSCLGPRHFNLDRGMLKLNWDHNLIYQLWTPWQDFYLQTRFARLPLLECTRVALSSSAPAQVLLEQGTGWRCALFTAGSARKANRDGQ